MQKEKSFFTSFWKVTLLILFLLFLDLSTKAFFTGKSYGEGGLVYISYSENYGSSFGMFSSFEYYSLLIVGLSIVVVVWMMYMKDWFENSKYMQWMFIVLIAGILGNTYDRLFFGYVRDFIGLKYLFIFNIADVFISLAFVLYVLDSLKDSKRFGKWL